MAASIDAAQLLALVPADGSPIGNMRLRELLSDKLGHRVSEEEYAEARDALVERGALARRSGRGGSICRVGAAAKEELILTMPEPGEKSKAGRSNTATGPIGRRSAKATGNTSAVVSYRHDQKRRNNPEVGMVDPESDPDEVETRWAYDPHIDPAMQFDVKRADVERIIDDALGSGDEGAMRDALAALKRMADPYLNWAGKAERTSFEVDTVSLHVHERIDPATILAGIRRRMTKKGEEKVLQTDIFRAWFEEPLPYYKAVEFYKHDRGWSNRLITGDSLLVMNSLVQKEGMSGQVQMVYFDPPYGIKYGSNFQPFVDKRDVKDRKDEDLTQEPEMIKAFRDTWELGIHSYLTYLRDRLRLAREMLHDSGSVFVQISDKNLHHVREVLDDVFKASNFVALITYSTTGGFSSATLSRTGDYVVWYAKNQASMKFRKLFLETELRDAIRDDYDQLELKSGLRRPMTSGEKRDPSHLADLGRPFTDGDSTSQGVGPATADFAYRGLAFHPGSANHWKAPLPNGMRRVAASRRLQITPRGTLRYIRYFADFGHVPVTNAWFDVAGAVQDRADPKVFVVQTSSKIIERCLLMATEPGDLVLDPTCGSGTTAFVAEKWGRRWITCDTSRVAVTLAKQRLMTASYDYYELKYPAEGLRGGFVYKAAPHVTLGSIANNPEIDEIWDRMHPAVSQALEKLNSALRANPPALYEVTEGGRKGSALNFRAPGDRTVELPSGEKAPAGALLEWEVPFDLPADWPTSARAPFTAFHAAREALQRQMDASIAAHAESETLFDQPQIARDKLRVSGPLTVEAVPFPTVLSLDETEHGGEADVSIARSGESARQHDWRDELIKTGIRGKGGQILRLAGLEMLPGTRYLHCSGTLAESGDRVVVSFGPEYAALEQRQVELAMREAGELFPRPKMIVFCAFAFDPEAAKDVDATRGITALKAQMNTDLLTEDLKKARASNQSFWLMGQPDVDVRQRKDGRYEVEVNGFDYFDTAKGELMSGGKGRIAAWLLDTDYDERSLFPRQVFFPMAGAKDGWQKLRKDIKAELDETLLAKLHSTVSLPFEAGENKKVAVKIVDDRGIESLKVIPLS
jgi:adenine-specific DNA-methyltransferase